MRDQLNFGDAERRAQTIRGHLHRPRRRRTPRLRLRECSGHRGVERHVAFHLLHGLVDMAVEHRHRSKPFEQAQRLFAILRAPSPVLIHGP